MPAALNVLSNRVIGAAMEVHRRLGPGLMERIYEEALCVELGLRGIEWSRQVLGDVRYRGVRVGECRIDVLVENCLILELKSVEKLLDLHRAQLSSYLQIFGVRLGLLLNFNVPMLKNGIRRVLGPP